MLKRIKGVTYQLQDKTTIVWTSPYSFYHYNAQGELIDSSRRKSGMTVEQAHQYTDNNSTKTKLCAA